MGVVRNETFIHNNITYQCKTFPASEAYNLYADIGSVVPEKVLKLIMLPVSGLIEQKRKGKLEQGESIDKAIGVNMEGMVAMLETPGVIATIGKEIFREAADYPGGIAALMKKVLRQTTATPLRTGLKGGGDQIGDLQTNFDMHFDTSITGLFEALRICVWVVRVNLGGASSAGV